MTYLTRRSLMLGALAGGILPARAPRAQSPREITWDDLVPPGIPYSEIIAEGEMDEINDTWKPIFDENGTKLNEALDGAFVRMPGYITPLEMDATGVREFLLVPYLGACIHVPPPPPNQLVFVTTQTPWPTEKMLDAIWVTGQLRTHIQDAGLAIIGYEMQAQNIELYEW